MQHRNNSITAKGIEDMRGMALRAGLVALSTELETGSQRLWFTGVNGYGSYERKKKLRWRHVASLLERIESME